MRPSFLGLIASGLTILLALIIIIVNYDEIHTEHGIMIVLLFAIAISCHSVQHAFEELFYKFNPLVGNWKPTTQPVPLK